MSDQKPGIKGRVYLTPEQVSPAAETFGCDRFLYNRLWEFEQKRYAKDWTKAYKQDRDVERNGLEAEFPWLYDANAQLLQQSKRKLDTAWDHFFSTCKTTKHCKGPSLETSRRAA